MAWVERRPAGDIDVNWYKASVSDDGSTILLGTNEGRLWLSIDRGVNWTEQQPNDVDSDRAWRAIAVSGNGQVLLAGEYETDGRLYRSIDSGANWSELQPVGDTNQIWLDAALDYDGSVIMAHRYASNVYISSDSGVNWGNAGVTGTLCVACSSDGAVMLVGKNSGRLYLSINTGASFSETQPNGANNYEWNAVAVSGDGSVLACGIFNVSLGRPVYLSFNTGTNWTAQATTAKWNSLSIADDEVTILRSNTGAVWGTENAGTNWSNLDPDGSEEAKNWITAKISRNGQLYIAAISGGRLWIQDNYEPPAHKVADPITIGANVPIIGYSSIYIPTAAMQIAAQAASIREGRNLFRAFPTIESHRSFPTLFREFPV